MATDNQTRKETYAIPSVEVIRMENEGLIAVSGEAYNPVSRTNSGSTPVRNYNSASSSDLEDLISDILTVEN